MSIFENLTAKELVELYSGKPNLTKALVKAMSEIEGIEKNSVVGAGTRSEYKAVSDKDVKQAVRVILIQNGLTIIPAVIDNVTSHLEQDKGSYKQTNVFVDAKVTYMIMHDSGECVPAQGIGHGVDPQDKAAGKATTYALKYLELYLFQIPTGAIDDAENTQPEDLKQKTANTQTTNSTANKAKTNQTKPKEQAKTTASNPPAAEPKQRTKEEVIKLLDDSKSIQELTTNWNLLTADERKLGSAKKDELKNKFIPPQK